MVDACQYTSRGFWIDPPRALPTLLHSYCTTIAQHRTPPTDPRCIRHTPYDIGHGDIVQRPSSVSGQPFLQCGVVPSVAARYLEKKPRRIFEFFGTPPLPVSPGLPDPTIDKNKRP